MIEMLQKNAMITEMDLRWNYIEGDYMNKIDTYLQRNKYGTHGISTSSSNDGGSNPETTTVHTPKVKERLVVQSPELIPLVGSFDTNIFNLSQGAAAVSSPSFKVSADVLKDAMMLSVLSVGDSFRRDLQHNASKSTDRLDSRDGKALAKTGGDDEDGDAEYGEDFDPEQSGSNPSRPPSTAGVKPQRPAKEAPSSASASPLQMRRNLSSSLLAKERTSPPGESSAISDNHVSQLRELQSEHQQAVHMLLAANQNLQLMQTAIDEQKEVIRKMDMQLPSIRDKADKIASRLNIN